MAAQKRGCIHPRDPGADDRTGIETAEITLHVGFGTFQPVRVEKVEEHRLHLERYGIAAEGGQP